MLSLVSTLTVALVLAIAALVVLASSAAAHRAGYDRAASRRLARAVALGMLGWLAVVALLSVSGVLADFEARPPRLMLVVVGAFGLFFTATRTRTFARLIAATPFSWPVALQSMRVPIELGLWGLFQAGRLPIHLTFEGRNFDVLVGASAPVVAIALSRGWLGWRGAVVWNVLSLGLLANIVGMAITSVPGPLHLPWPGVPNTVVAEFPFAWLPGFLVPMALFLHVTSLRQLLGRRSLATKPDAPGLPFGRRAR
jgi:hypothetical protein